MENEENKNTNIIKAETLTNKKVYQIKDEGNKTYSNYGKIEIFIPKKIKSIVANKIIFLNNLHDFFFNFSSNIYSIFNKINLHLQKKLENTLDQNKYFLKFFKNTIISYEKFSSELIKSKAVLTVLTKEEKLIFNEINSIIDNSQEILASNLMKFAETLNQKIILKGPLLQMKTFSSRLKILTKQINDDLQKIKSKNEKLLKKYLNFQPIFEELCKLNEDEELMNYFNLNEIFIFEVSYTKSMNVTIHLIKSFLVNYIKVYEELKEIIYDFFSSMKNTIEIYLDANKKIFLDSSELDKIQIAFDNINKEAVELNFQPSTFFKQNLNDINESLKEFQSKLIKNNFVKYDSNYLEETILLDNFKSLEEFLIYFLDIIPEGYCVDNSSLLTYLSDIKYDPGLVFSSWRSAMIVLTIQNNIFIFEKRIQKKYSEKISLNNIKYTEKLNSKNLNDFRFEISEVKKGFFSKSKKIILEAMNRDKFTDIRNVFSYYYKYSGSDLNKSQFENYNTN